MGSLVQLSFDPSPRASQTEPEHFWGPLLVLWVGSAARVTLALAHREVFETEATLALLCVVSIPLGALRSWRESRGVRRQSPAEPPPAVHINFADAKLRRAKRTRRDFNTRGAM
jgi:hypothetical protein